MRLILILFAALVTATDVNAVVPEQSVFGGPRNSHSPGVDWNGTVGVVSWARSRAGHPAQYDAWVKVGTDAPIKLNQGGMGFGGGIDYPTVVYGRVLNGQSNIYLYDLSTGTRPSTPAGINTGKYEYRPSIAGDWLLFGRDNNRGPVQRIILHNRISGNERVIARVGRRGPALYPGQVSGGVSAPLASYTRCVGFCDVRWYNIATRLTTTLSKPSRRTHQYNSAVGGAAVYVVRSGQGCGVNVRIVRYGAGDPQTGTVVARLPERRDIGYMSARQSEDGTVEVFYGRVICPSSRWDVYKITDPPSPP